MESELCSVEHFGVIFGRARSREDRSNEKLFWHKPNMEGYRSGHNEAVLKTVWVHAHVGSNPTPSVKKTDTLCVSFFFYAKKTMLNPANRRFAVADGK